MLWETEARDIFQQVVSALGYLHRRGLVWRDLKSSNILLNLEKNSIKCCDFGFIGTTARLSLLCFASPVLLAPDSSVRSVLRGPAPERISWHHGLLPSRSVYRNHVRPLRLLTRQRQRW